MAVSLLEIDHKLNWQEIEATSSKLLSRLVGFDTSNPPGDTQAAARFIYEVLFSDGIFATLLPTEGFKRNLVAQIDGSGQAEPILLLSPMDVVSADPATWSEFNPFSGYDDGTYIWGRGTIAAKSMLVAQIMVMTIVAKLGLPLKRHLRFAAVTDGFSPDGSGGVKFLVENYLPLIEAERCLTWGFPTSVKIGGKSAFFLNRADRGSLRLLLHAEGKLGILGEPDAARVLMQGIRALADEFDADYGRNDETDSVYGDLLEIADDDAVAAELSEIARRKGNEISIEPGKDILPGALKSYLRSLNRTQLTILNINTGPLGTYGPKNAGAEILITPRPGMSLFDCGTKTVSTLEKLGRDAPYIAKAAQFHGSVSPPDDELRRVLLGAVRSVIPDAELVDGICPFTQGLDVLRQLGIGVYGFQPVEFADGLDDGAKRIFGDNERIAKSSLSNLIRIMLEAVVRLAS